MRNGKKNIKRAKVAIFFKKCHWENPEGKNLMLNYLLGENNQFMMYWKVLDYVSQNQI